MLKINMLAIIWVAVVCIAALALQPHFPYLLHSIVILSTGALVIGLLILQDLKRKSVSQLMPKNMIDENQFRLAFDNAAVGMAMLTLRGKFVKVNQALCQILDLTEEELLHVSIRKLVNPDDFKKELGKIRELMRGEKNSAKVVHRSFNKRGEIIWLMANISVIRDEKNKPVYFIAQFQNVSSERRSEESLRHMAYHDPLTGLDNRHRLEQYIPELISTSKQRNEIFSLISLDLDLFKTINDTLGHDAGDTVLEVVSDRLKSTVRSKDLVARVGGDEFIIIINDTKNTDVCAKIAEKILYNVLKPITVHARELYLTTSIGIAVYPYDGQDLETLQKSADVALYRAKERGRNRYEFCDQDITQLAQEKMERENALNRAFTKEEFILHYQPIVDAKTQKIMSVEALLRWQSKEHGLVTPDRIISIAEDTGLIVPLSEWVLRNACKQLKQWHQAGFTDLKLSVNISARQFKSADFIKGLLLAISQTDIKPSMLTLEVTESLIMYDYENMFKIITALKDAGIGLAIDDFGTGFHSFSYLTKYSVDQIKIDKTFVHQITVDKTSENIVSAMIAMANKLQIKSVAEAVETKEQYDILVREGCNELQGYYFSRPLPVDQMNEYLKKTQVIQE